MFFPPQMNYEFILRIATLILILQLWDKNSQNCKIQIWEKPKLWDKKLRLTFSIFMPRQKWVSETGFIFFMKNTCFGDFRVMCVLERQTESLHKWSKQTCFSVNRVLLDIERRLRRIKHTHTHTPLWCSSQTVPFKQKTTEAPIRQARRKSKDGIWLVGFCISRSEAEPVSHGGGGATDEHSSISRLYFIDLRIKIIWIKSLGSYSDSPTPAYLQTHGCKHLTDKC